MLRAGSKKSAGGKRFVEPASCLSDVYGGSLMRVIWLHPIYLCRLGLKTRSYLKWSERDGNGGGLTTDGRTQKEVSVAGIESVPRRQANGFAKL